MDGVGMSKEKGAEAPESLAVGGVLLEAGAEELQSRDDLRNFRLAPVVAELLEGVPCRDEELKRKEDTKARRNPTRKAVPSVEVEVLLGHLTLQRLRGDRPLTRRRSRTKGAARSREHERTRSARCLLRAVALAQRSASRGPRLRGGWRDDCRGE